MSTVSLIEIKMDGMVSEHKSYCSESSNTLAVFFPGGGNSCDRPLLHYLRNYLLESKCDVLCISYSNLFAKKDSQDVKMGKIIQSAYNAITHMEDKKKYQDIIFVSRSVGNIASSELRMKHSIVTRKSIYISPTSEALKYISNYPGLVVTSSNDEHLQKGDIEKLKKNNKDLLIFENGSHSLETGNLIETIDFHKSVITRAIKYIERGA